MCLVTSAWAVCIQDVNPINGATLLDIKLLKSNTKTTEIINPKITDVSFGNSCCLFRTEDSPLVSINCQQLCFVSTELIQELLGILDLRVHLQLLAMHMARSITTDQGCGVVVWTIAQGRSRSPTKKEVCIGRTCFHSLTEYNEIMVSA